MKVLVAMISLALSFGFSAFGDMKAMMIALMALIVIAVTAPAAIVYRRDNQRQVTSQQQVANEMDAKRNAVMGPNQVHNRKK